MRILGPSKGGLMMKFAAALVAGAAVSFLFCANAKAAGKVVGVSWANFQEERWKTDEAAMKAAIAAAGDKYISADAQSSAQKQLADVESLIARNADVLIVLAQDASAIAPAVQKAVDEGIPVIGYDRLIENRNAFYITFDNKEVGRLQARAVFAVKPSGNYAFIKGSSADPNADFLFAGQMDVLKDAIAAGKIRNVGESYTDGWLPANAQRNMEQILTKNNNKVDAVVAAMTAPPAAPSPRSRRKAWPAPCRFPARTAITPRSTASRLAPRLSRCGRMRASSAGRRPRSPCCWRTARR